MPVSLPISHFTPIISLYLLILLHSTLTIAVNITHVLSPFPDLSDFSDILSTTTVAADLSHRTSLTLLAVPNSFLRSSDLLRHQQRRRHSLLLGLITQRKYRIEQYTRLHKRFTKKNTYENDKHDTRHKILTWFDPSGGPTSTGCN